MYGHWPTQGINVIVCFMAYMKDDIVSKLPGIVNSQLTTIDLLFEIVKDNQPCQVLPTLSGSTYLVRFYPPCQAQGRLKNSPGRRSNFPAKDLVLHSSLLQKICAEGSSNVKLLFLKQLLLQQAALLHAWVVQLLPQLVILPGCQPTPLSPHRSSCPCDSNSEKVINFY